MHGSRNTVPHGESVWKRCELAYPEEQTENLFYKNHFK